MARLRSKHHSAPRLRVCFAVCCRRSLHIADLQSDAHLRSLTAGHRPEVRKCPCSCRLAVLDSGPKLFPCLLSTFMCMFAVEAECVTAAAQVSMQDQCSRKACCHRCCSDGSATLTGGLAVHRLVICPRVPHHPLAPPPATPRRCTEPVPCASECC